MNAEIQVTARNQGAPSEVLSIADEDNISPRQRRYVLQELLDWREQLLNQALARIDDIGSRVVLRCGTAFKASAFNGPYHPGFSSPDLSSTPLLGSRRGQTSAAGAHVRSRAATTAPE